MKRNKFKETQNVIFVWPLMYQEIKLLNYLAMTYIISIKNVYKVGCRFNQAALFVGKNYLYLINNEYMTLYSEKKNEKISYYKLVSKIDYFLI